MGQLPFAPVTELVGIVGVLLYLGSYAALQLGFLHGQTYAYARLNAVAAACVLFSLANSFNLSSALIQISWIAISLAGILRLWIAGLVSARISFTDDEQAFLCSMLPMLPKQQARRLLDAGYWIDGAPGAVITREREPVGEPVYLARGAVALFLHRHGNLAAARRPALGAATSLEDSFAGDTRKKLVMARRHFQHHRGARKPAGIGF